MEDIYNPNQDIYVDRSEHKLVVKKTQDVTPILEENKMFRNHIPEAQKGDFQRIAQIPLIALQIKTKELHGHSNWYKLDKDQQSDVIKKMVNSNEFQNFRIGSKKL
jgi:hypothetical protein|tara:strand:+ start:2326 stop:2643 length:318 start_codon:yes stop_codon:yes gene_type:complete